MLACTICLFAKQVKSVVFQAYCGQLTGINFNDDMLGGNTGSNTIFCVTLWEEERKVP